MSIIMFVTDTGTDVPDQLGPFFLGGLFGTTSYLDSGTSLVAAISFIVCRHNSRI